MKKRITLRPRAFYSVPHQGYLPTIETWCDGQLCNQSLGREVFATRALATQFAETRALGVIDELLRHYGDVYTFTVVCASPWERQPLPGWLVRDTQGAER